MLEKHCAYVFANASFWVERRTSTFESKVTKDIFRATQTSLANPVSTQFRVKGNLKTVLKGSLRWFLIVLWVDYKGEQVFFQPEVATGEKNVKEQIVVSSQYINEYCMRNNIILNHQIMRKVNLSNELFLDISIALLNFPSSLVICSMSVLRRERLRKGEVEGKRCLRSWKVFLMSDFTTNMYLKT